MKSFVKDACTGHGVSSKRVLMFLFAGVACFMILVESVNFLFTYIKVDKIKDIADYGQVFADIIWYCVFGVITGLAGINGFGKQNQQGNNNEQIEQV